MAAVKNGIVRIWALASFNSLFFPLAIIPRLVMMKPPPLVCASGKFTSFFGGKLMETHDFLSANRYVTDLYSWAHGFQFRYVKFFQHRIRKVRSLCRILSASVTPSSRWAWTEASRHVWADRSRCFARRPWQMEMVIKEMSKGDMGASGRPAGFKHGWICHTARGIRGTGQRLQTGTTMDAKPTISWYITPITKSYGYNFITYNNITSGTAHPSMNFGNMLKCFWIYFDAGLYPPAAVKLLPKRRGLNIGESYSLEIPENSRLVWWVCHRAPLWVTRGWYSPIGHQGYVDWIIYIPPGY